MLTATGLRKQYDGRTVLDAVSVELREGAIVALLGANGCGKSTLLRALALIEPEVAGSIHIDGRTWSSASAAAGPDSPWPSVTMVFQQLFLWPHLTVRRNIMLPPTAAGNTNAAERFDDVVRTFELRDLIDRYPNEISLGQRQRVALARAVAAGPRYLLLDEVTSALDIEHVVKLRETLRRLGEQSGIGILLVTHLIGFARTAADEVLFMSGGRIMERGDVHVLSAPATKELARFLAVVESSEGRPAASRTERVL